ncbi:hypothetical protein PL321_18215 [Caloramator sp. mosi_1]|uniref:hypothetical protein n=1 Tax=Caloramator sp. mosi_1 TaxID=3023090 RepID=UPI002361464E|nr:hypothetical protein [Caloramator sp. mosi_1]WDC84163.1 hypothetical protein PL321_18215 [Caloramator sp. mosi_1]
MDGDDKLFLKESETLLRYIGRKEKDLYEDDLKNEFTKPVQKSLEEILEELNIPNWVVENIRGGCKTKELTQIKIYLL